LPGLNEFKFFFDSMKVAKGFKSKKGMILLLKKLEFLRGKIDLMRF
jgi:hypothetical protein